MTLFTEVVTVMMWVRWCSWNKSSWDKIVCESMRSWQFYFWKVSSAKISTLPFFLSLFNIFTRISFFFFFLLRINFVFLVKSTLLMSSYDSIQRWRRWKSIIEWDFFLFSKSCRTINRPIFTMYDNKFYLLSLALDLSWNSGGEEKSCASKSDFDWFCVLGVIINHIESILVEINHSLDVFTRVQWTFFTRFN